MAKGWTPTCLRPSPDAQLSLRRAGGSSCAWTVATRQAWAQGVGCPHGQQSAGLEPRSSCGRALQLRTALRAREAGHGL